MKPFNKKLLLCIGVFLSLLITKTFAQENKQIKPSSVFYPKGPSTPSVNIPKRPSVPNASTVLKQIPTPPKADNKKQVNNSPILFTKPQQPKEPHKAPLVKNTEPTKHSPVQPKENLPFTTVKFIGETTDFSFLSNEKLEELSKKVNSGKTSRIQLFSYSYSSELTKSEILQLSLKRGIFLRDYLAKFGIDTKRVDIRPDQDKTEDNNHKNRIDLLFLE